MSIMTKGKYAQRARTRLEQLESERIRELAAEKAELERQLHACRQSKAELERDVQSKAMRLAAGLSADEKRYLRNQIAVLENQANVDRMHTARLCLAAAFQCLFDAEDKNIGRPTAVVELLSAVVHIFKLSSKEMVEFMESVPLLDGRNAGREWYRKYGSAKAGRRYDTKVVERLEHKWQGFLRGEWGRGDKKAEVQAPHSG